jgi:polysaccharide biosynthesis protein PslH
VTGTCKSSTSGRPRLLFLTHRVPYPPDKGDRIRSWQLLKRLSAQYDIWLGCLADEPWTTETESVLKILCSDVKIAPLGIGRWWHGLCSLVQNDPLTLGLFTSRELKRWVNRVTSEVSFDCMVAFCSNMTSYTRLPCVSKIPLLVDLVDVDSEKWSEYADRAAWPRRLIYQREFRLLQRVERELGQRAAAVMLTTEAELNLYRRHAPEAASYALGNGVEIDYFRRPATHSPAEKELVFVGAMDYRPNAEGMIWFCEHVWPQVRQQIPSAVLRIVGRRPGPAVQGLSRIPGVQIHADVPDVRPYLFGAKVAIVPLHVARGVQNKVLEALACETPVIASPAALTGLDLLPGEEALSASEPAEWISKITQLLQNDEECRRLAIAGRRYVEQNCRWDQQLAPMDQLLAQMCETRSVAKPVAHSNRSLPVATA